MSWREVFIWFTPKRVLLILLLLTILPFLFIFSKPLATILFPFLTALVLAAVIEPIVELLERKLKLPRNVAVMVTLASTMLLAGYILFLVVAKTVTELVDLASLLPLYRSTIVDFSNDLFSQFENLNESLPPIVSVNIQRSLEEFLKALEAGTREVINRVVATFAGLPVFFVVSIIIVVSTYFISKDKQLLLNLMFRLIPEKLHERVESAKEGISYGLVGFVKARLVLLAIATGIAALGLFLINTRYWMLLAILIGVLDNIPVVGPGVIFTPWVGIAILMGDINRAVYLAVLYTIIFAFRQLVEPKIMGDSIGIHPLAMVMAMYAGIVFFGVLGLFIGPMILIIIRATILAGLFKPEAQGERREASSS